MEQQILTVHRVKLVLGIALLLCLLPMPYGYYQLVRFAAMCGFAWLAYQVRDNNEQRMWIYIALALLFQPFIKIALGRALWNVVDLVVGVWLIYEVRRK